MSDVMEIASVFNSASGDGRYTAICDLDMDNAINLGDIMIQAAHFGTDSSSYPAINIQ
jgi:hypothetical protein